MSLLRLMNDRIEQGATVPSSARPKDRVIDWTFPADGVYKYTKPVTARALARLNAIYDEASALGWTHARLCQNRAHVPFPEGPDFGLACAPDGN